MVWWYYGTNKDDTSGCKCHETKRSNTSLNKTEVSVSILRGSSRTGLETWIVVPRRSQHQRAASMIFRHEYFGLGFMALAVAWLVDHETSTIVPYNSRSSLDTALPNFPRPSPFSADDNSKIKAHFTAQRLADDTRRPDSTAWWTKFLNESFCN